ncbi:MAG TPA: hypothetical protein VK808_09275 [Bacteroidia bacterium]|nr:hypothetical protein [Bacteroidia bacterium]
MNINLNNYEAYFLDYYEGSLSPALVMELMEFVAKHPELKEEFENVELIALTDTDKIKFDKKESLKKSLTGINTANFDEYAIQFVEGTLSPDLQHELKAFIGQNAQYKRELDLYTKTKLVPDTSIVLEDKYLLKRRNRRPVAFYYWSAAASVAIIIGTYFLLNKNKVPAPSGNNIVKHNKIKDSNTVANHSANSIDSGKGAIPNSLPKTPVIHVVKNNTVAIKSVIKKQRKHELHAPANVKDNSTEARAIVANLSPLQLRPASGIVFTTESFCLPFYGNYGNSTLPDNLIKNNQGNNSPTEYADLELHPEKKGNKFLYLIAKFTCKGLHKITGQHIEMEKRYDSDTTNIIAYQLDLGNKKINFPVKE